MLSVHQRLDKKLNRSSGRTEEARELFNDRFFDFQNNFKERIQRFIQKNKNTENLRKAMLLVCDDPDIDHLSKLDRPTILQEMRKLMPKAKEFMAEDVYLFVSTIFAHYKVLNESNDDRTKISDTEQLSLHFCRFLEKILKEKKQQ